MSRPFFLRPCRGLRCSATTFFRRSVLANETSDSIADRDAIAVLTAEKKHVKIRFNVIDAPERGQPFGTKSKEMLPHLIGDLTVRAETRGEDRYGRTIGDVFATPKTTDRTKREVNINFMMVTNGYAWHYVRYAPENKELADAEKHAREKKLGLWLMLHRSRRGTGKSRRPTRRKLASERASGSRHPGAPWRLG